MSVKFFLDTNILVYTFDPTNDVKRERASSLIQNALTTGQGCISFQVMEEFLNLCMRKFSNPMSKAQALLYLSEVLTPLCTVYPTPDLLVSALELQERYRHSFYDSLVLAAALEARCDVLYSEDFQHEQTIGGLKITNPFVDERAP